MKIAFIGGRNIHKLGGIENYMYNLATELVKRGYEPIVFCESDRNGTEWVNGFQVVHQKSLNSKFWNKPILGLKAIVRILRYDKTVNILHFNAGGPAYFAWIARMFGRITIYQGHGIEWRRTKWKWYQRLIMRLTNAYVVLLCTKYATAVSEEQTEMLNRLYHKKCVTISTAVNVPVCSVESAVLQKYGLENNDYCLFLGRLVQDKNPDYLIRAYIQSGIIDKKLVIAGSNDADPAYVRQLKEMAQEYENIIFTGAVYGVDKEKLLESCFAFCIPSTIEGLAITLLEAMSYGKICIASDILANKEGLGENGLWVKAEDEESLCRAMKYVCEHYSELKKSGILNQNRVRTHFTWDKIAGKYELFIKSLK